MEVDFGELLASEGGSSYEKHPVVWLYEWPQLLEELHLWNGAGEQTRIKAGSNPFPGSLTTKQGGLQPWADFSCQKFQNAHGKPFIRTKKKTRQLIFQRLLRQGRSEKECIGDFIFLNWEPESRRDLGTVLGSGMALRFLGSLFSISCARQVGIGILESWASGRSILIRETEPCTRFSLCWVGVSCQLSIIFSISMLLFLIFIFIFLLLLQVLHPSSDFCWIFPYFW